ncbi:hypothetical protein BWQ93_01615 [Sphingopyxis sp. QXT-31]|nr:hypothetical protein BWQ93_01615 [Sphingopyxis sp. QXT-31]
MDGGIPELYALSALAGIAASALLVRFVVLRERRAKQGLPTDLHGLSEALVAVAFSLGFAGVGYLLSI